MSQHSALEQVGQYGVVPVIAIESVEHAIPLADALLQGGLPIVEITFRTAAAADVIGVLSSKRPQLLVGAGTVLTMENLEAARASGARFAVAPGLNPRIAAQAQAIGLPFVPGIATPSEIEQAMALGCRTLKFFPAESLGGVDMLKAMSAPYAHTGVRFVPTGGVSIRNLESYLQLPSVAAVGGTWIAKSEDIAAGHWDEIARRCQGASEVVAKLRSRG